MKSKTRTPKTKTLSLLLSLALMLGLLTGMTAYAADGAYGDYVNTTTTVKFNDMDWYIIEDNSTAVNAGTVTLFAKNPIYESVFGGTTYGTSAVKEYLDGLTAEGGTFADVADAIVSTDLTDVGVTGVKLYLLNAWDEAAGLPKDIKKCDWIGEEDIAWWLRTTDPVSMYFVEDDGENKIGMLNFIYDCPQGVRPALKLDLSKVTFDSVSKKFELSATAVSATATYAQAGDYTSKTEIDNVASLWTVTVTPGSDTITSLDVKVNDKSSNEGAWTDIPVITSGTVQFAVAVNLAAANVNSVTAVVNGDDVNAAEEAGSAVGGGDGEDDF